MKLNYIFTGLILACLSLGSCTSDFEETNIDPNRLQQVSPATLLSPMLYESISHGMYRSWSHNNHLMQDIVPFPSVVDGLQRYDLSDNIGGSSWNAYFRWYKNALEMETEAVASGNPNYEAIALTLQSLYAANLTDIFGQVPYSEAGKGELGVLTPVFDTQEFIYKDILAKLERANTLYNEKLETTFGTDILIKDAGSYWKQWRKFTNSLHLRLLLRASNRAELNANAKMVAMINDPIQYPIIESNEESIILEISGVAPNLSPWARPQDFTTSRKMASFFIDNLNDFNDPRLPLYSTRAYIIENKKQVYIGYKGIPSAWDGPESQFKYEASGLNNIIALNPTKAPVLTYAEVLFMKAELAQKGLLPDAAGLYEAAVTAAITTTGIEMPEDYFENPAAAYDGSLERIMLQKYYALYMNDYQQWFEHKRTGYPVLPTTKSMLNDGKMPNRFPYPIDVRRQFKDQYEAAMNAMGGQDDINARMWWQD